MMQTFTFYASDDKLGNRGNKAAEIGVSLALFILTVVFDNPFSKFLGF